MDAPKFKLPKANYFELTKKLLGMEQSKKS